MNLLELTLVITKYSLLFSNLSISPELVKVWHGLFRSESMQDFQAALESAVKKPNQKYFPTPGEVQLELNNLHCKRFPEAGLIWETLLTYAQQGFELSKVLQLLDDNEPAKSAVRQVGWQAIRLSNIQTELPWRKKDFQTFYDSACESFEASGRIQISHEQSKAIINQIPGANKIKALN